VKRTCALRDNRVKALRGLFVLLRRECRQYLDIALRMQLASRQSCSFNPSPRPYMQLSACLMRKAWVYSFVLPFAQSSCLKFAESQLIAKNASLTSSICPSNCSSSCPLTCLSPDLEFLQPPS